MSITTRFNRATNPQVAVAATGYSAVAGTGGTAAGARNAGVGFPNGALGFFRVTWSVGTTAVSGGAQYLQAVLSASTAYTHTLWVRSSKAQTVRLTAQYQTSASANVGSAVTGSAVALAADTWTPVQVAGTSGAGVDRVVLQVVATTGGVFWNAADTLDVGGVLIETGTTFGSYFDGSFANGANVMYSWLGGAHASTSSAITYMPQINTVIKPLFDPTPRVEITLQDFTPTSNTVTLWRTAGGKRQAVRGFRKREVITSDYVVDYEVPLGRSVSYEIEVLAGLNAQAATFPVIITVDAASGALQDPLVPGSSVPVYGTVGPGGQAYIRDQALKDLEYGIDASVIPIMGSPDPVGILGQRMAARGVDISMSTRAAQMASDMRKLLQSAGLVLFRPLPNWAAALPGQCYMVIGEPHEQPMDEAWGGNLIRWELKGDLVAAPNMNVLVPVWTYGDVSNLYLSYQQAQTTLAGKTYLDTLKNPAGS